MSQTRFGSVIMKLSRIRFMTVRKCKECGADVTGRRQYCGVCLRLRRLNQCRENVRRFNAKNKTLKTCICCGKELPLWGKKYCHDCAGISQRIIARYVMRDRISAKQRPEDYQRLLASPSVSISDMTFKTDKCDQDCFNCKYEDCIL